jgi:hypothetical protein
VHDTIILKTPSKADNIERVGMLAEGEGVTAGGWRINLSVVAILAIIAWDYTSYMAGIWYCC